MNPHVSPCSSASHATHRCGLLWHTRIKQVVAACLLPWLAGCLAWPVAKQTASPLAAVGHYHFDWKLSGNRAVAPLQIFDDGKQTWLQFPAGQPVPAVFARLPQGDQLLAPVAGQGGMLMLPGVWPQLVMRGGTLQSRAQRLSALDNTVTSSSPVSPAIPPETAPGMALVPDPPARVTSAAPGVFAPPVALPPSVPVAATTVASVTAPTAVAEPAPVFQVSPQDGTLRAALSRWADTAGWTFGFEHWAVGVDIPVVANATFPHPFTQAVQALVASTELSDQPLRPCFYTNQVLRIVAQTQSCDRSAAMPGQTVRGM